MPNWLQENQIEAGCHPGVQWLCWRQLQYYCKCTLNTLMGSNVNTEYTKKSCHRHYLIASNTDKHPFSVFRQMRIIYIYNVFNFIFWVAVHAVINERSLKVFSLQEQARVIPSTRHKANIHTVMVFEFSAPEGASQIYFVSTPVLIFDDIFDIMIRP